MLLEEGKRKGFDLLLEEGGGKRRGFDLDVVKVYYKDVITPERGLLFLMEGE